MIFRDQTVAQIADQMDRLANGFSFTLLGHVRTDNLYAPLPTLQEQFKANFSELNLRIIAEWNKLDCISSDSEKEILRTNVKSIFQKIIHSIDGFFYQYISRNLPANRELFKQVIEAIVDLKTVSCGYLTFELLLSDRFRRKIFAIKSELDSKSEKDTRTTFEYETPVKPNQPEVESPWKSLVSFRFGNKKPPETSTLERSFSLTGNNTL